MKVRSCFVSNSSTSSFVVLGFYVTKEDEIAMGEERWEEVEESEAFLYNEPQSIVGDILAYQRDYMLENTQFTIAELTERAKQVAEEFGVDISRIKLITGVHMS